MKKILLDNFKTSLSDLKKKEENKISKKLVKYILNPFKIFPRIIWEIKKYFKETNWDERSAKMGNSSVFGNQISLSEQKKITDIHEKILLKCLNGNIELGSNVLDFGCGYGRFSDFFIKKFNCNYIGVENNEFFLKNFQNSKNKTFLSFNDLKDNKTYENYFDLLFVFAVFGGFKKNKASNIFQILEKKVKPGGKIFVVEAISNKEVEDEWSFRTEEFYKNLFNNFDISTEYYFLEDDKFNQIFKGTKL